MTKPTGRTADCSKADAKSRFEQAVASLEVARLALDGDDPGRANAATSNAVTSGIAASDAACCHVLGKRPHGQNHEEAVALLETIPHRGVAKAKLLRRLLGVKHLAQYGVGFLAKPEAARHVKTAGDLIDEVRSVLER